MDRLTLTKKSLAAGVVTLVLLGAAPARAAVLNTHPLMSNGSNAVSYLCLVTNIGTKPISDVSVVMTNGIATSTGTTNLPPGLTAFFGVGGSFATTLRCTASGKFSKKSVLLTMELVDGSGTRAATEGK